MPGNELKFVPLKEIQRLRESGVDVLDLVPILADVFRVNALYMIERAGSGHVGSSFSSLDIVSWLWMADMNHPNEKDVPGADVYFSSKGHDVPGLYALLIGLEKLPFDYLHQLRRLGGLPGHPDVGTPFMVTNTGPLGMGISKARGLALANRLSGKKGHFYVLTGDGELQEGQIWESLQPTANGNFSEITVIVDHNKLQSDTLVERVSNLGSLEEKFRSFGWEVGRCNGHDVKTIKEALARLKTSNKPQVLIADTVKGKGVSFMEQPPADDLYKFHSGAPGFDLYEKALAELVSKINNRLSGLNLGSLQLESAEMPAKAAPAAAERLVAAYGDELVKLAGERRDIVAMDADLVFDTGLVEFKKKFPERYVECGIAEQDMVSFAGGLALAGQLPIVHSFECFLATRPNEQIYNNSSERTKIIYVGSLAGLLPATPGHSHQSVRGISALGSIPGLTMIEPANEAETRLALRWAVQENKGSAYIRLVNIPSEIPYSLPNDYRLVLGQGVKLLEGKDGSIIAYGPVMLAQAYKAALELKEKGIELAVINLPWLNALDSEWLKQAVSGNKILFTLDDHYRKLGQGSIIASAVSAWPDNKIQVVSFGLEDIPECGSNTEVLRHHGLDASSLSSAILEYFT